MAFCPQYDYIFAGAGCAGLSLVYRLCKNPIFRDKKILLVDKTPKNQNDRTWCFWSDKTSIFDEIIYQKWDHLWFKHPKFTKLLDISPYSYKMIRGIDFYEFTLNEISLNNQIDWAFGEIKQLESKTEYASLTLDNQVFTAKYIFDSLPKQVDIKPHYHYYLQHFKGWIIETPNNFFAETGATLMDFRIPQVESEARFFYVLPIASNRALIEFTVFSQALLEPLIYDLELKSYLNEFLQLSDYQIIEDEFGVIPMYDHPFEAKQGERIINLGTKGGMSKASTGYTFTNIQKHSDWLVEILAKNPEKIPQRDTPSRFRLYDSMLLNVMKQHRLPADEVFKRMFEKHPSSRVWRFLDEESHFGEEFLIMASMPPFPFLKALPKALGIF
jgi:lycopene beta-cyclase